MATFGWEKALGDEDELRWWERRVAEAVARQRLDLPAAGGVTSITTPAPGRAGPTGATLVYGPIAGPAGRQQPPPARPGGVVLDAGAGTGVAAVALRAEGARPVAVDLSYDMLA